MNTFSIQPDSIRFDDRGLVPAIVRDASSGRLLMLAWMNRKSLERTLENGETWFWSRQRQGLWHKGETSGNRQKVLAIREDCDGDALLIDVAPLGPACHTGSVSCFHDEPSVLEALYSRIVSRRGADPANSYTASLFAAGKNRILKKIGEEAIEVIVAAGNETRERVVSETADLLYHLLVMLAAEGITLEEVWAELTRRARPQ